MHSLLPIHLQNNLQFAAKSSHLDATIRRTQEERPDLFHTEQSIKDRVFYDEPGGAYIGSFINPVPPRI